MKSLGRLLRSHISESGYTIYKVANSAGINRTTLQKILADQRPASEELLQKLFPILKLSPQEEGEVWKLFEISQTGENLYRQRQCIRDLIESTASLDYFFYPDSFGAEDSTLFLPPPDSPFSCFLEADLPAPPLHSGVLSPVPVLGVHNVEQLICSFLSWECSGAAGAGVCGSQTEVSGEQGRVPEIPRSIRKILVSAPGNLPVLRRLFIHQLPNCPTRSKIELTHITPLIKTSGQSGLMLNNLEILSSILPFTISQAFHYEVYCFYRKELLFDSPQYAFPYYIIFSRGVILLSCDGHAALPLMEQEAISYFRNLFSASRKKASPLISTCTRPAEILQCMIRTGRESPFCTLEYQPCFSSFLTEDMIKKYLRPNLINREELIQSLCQMIRQMASMEKQACIFSKSGLKELALEGTISDFPSRYVLPVSIPDRIRLLKSLYLECRQDRQFLRLVNPVTLSLPRHLSFIVRKEHSVDFCGSPSQGFGYNYVHLTEPGIVECFEDFYNYLRTSSLIYTKEETLKEIEALLVSLSDMAYPPDSRRQA